MANLGDTRISGDLTVTGLVSFAEIEADIFNWVSSATYNLNDPTFYEGFPYRSLINNNTNKQPDINPSSWELTVKNNVNNTNAFSLSTKSKGLIIPMYIYPGFSSDDDSDLTLNRDDPDWWFNRLLSILRKYHNIHYMVIVNPSNGPGTVVDGNYKLAIRWLHNANATVVGYVSTDFNARSLGDVTNDINVWKNIYPEIDGIFLDEAPWATTQPNIDLYKQFTNFAHSLGFYPVIGNPGTLQQTNAFMIQKAFDMVVTYEQSNSSVTITDAVVGGDRQWNDTFYEISAKQKLALVHSQATFNKTIVDTLLRNVDHIYMTDDVLVPNPWDALPTYLEELVEYISHSHAYDYDASKKYFINDPIFYNGVPYRSLQNNNINKNPENEIDWWEVTGGGGNEMFKENEQLIIESYTITTGSNAMTVGPVTLDTGVTVTVPSGSNWVIL